MAQRGPPRQTGCVAQIPGESPRLPRAQLLPADVAFLGDKGPLGSHVCVTPGRRTLCKPLPKGTELFLLSPAGVVSCAWCPARAGDKLDVGGSCHVHMVFMI